MLLKPHFRRFFVCMVFLLANYTALFCQTPELVPGFREANDSIRLRLILASLKSTDTIQDEAVRVSSLRDHIELSREFNHEKGIATAHFYLFRFFSLNSKLDSAKAVGDRMKGGMLEVAACKNQLPFWILSGGNAIELSQPDVALAEYRQAERLADSCHLSKLYVYNGLAAVYNLLGESRKSLNNFLLAYQEAQKTPRPDSMGMAMILNNSSFMYDELKMEDSAYFFVQRALQIKPYPTFLIRAGVIAIKRNELEAAEDYFTAAQEMIAQTPNLQRFEQSLMLAWARLAMVQEEDAAPYASRALELARISKSPQYISSGYGLLIQAMHPEHSDLVDSMAVYQKVANNEKNAKAALDMQAKYETLEKEQQILALDAQVKDQQIQALKTRNYIFLAIGLAAILVLGISILIRSRQRKSQQEIDSLRKQAIKLQMNPHFFFNSLNSINLFIARNEKEEAQKYLVNFSKLMRLTLETSQTDTVSLEQEVEFLRNYLVLEQLRMKNFEFEFDIEKGLEHIRIPSLLIQPLLENSLLHGFQGIDYQGILKIKASSENGMLRIEVSDNGTGKTRASTTQAQIASEHKSYALGILRKRVANYSNKTAKVLFEPGITAGSNPGTKVSFRFPIIR